MMISMLNGYLFDGFMFPWMQYLGVSRCFLELMCPHMEPNVALKLSKFQGSEKYPIFQQESDHISAVHVSWLSHFACYVM